MSFADLIQFPHFRRKETVRKKVFKSFWMTSDENFEIIKRIETETAKKEADQKQKENIKKEAVMKFRKKKAAIKRKQKKNVVMKGLFVRECAEGYRCSRKTLCVCVWGKVLASGERGFQE